MAEDEQYAKTLAQQQSDQPPEKPPAARTTPMPKVLLKPKVAKQYAKRTAVTYRPYFTWIASAVQLLLVISGYFLNNKYTGKFIEEPATNIMIGPSWWVLVGMGARFVPCMRPVSVVAGKVFPCGTAQNAQATCTLNELCGFGAALTTEQPFQSFRFITPIFLHAGIVHLLFNMSFQLRTGMDMEKDMGTPRFAAIYMISGIFGFVFGANFSSVLSSSVGASGSLFGLIACLLLDLLQNWKLIENPKKELAKMAAMIIISFAVGLLPGFDNFAHIGGFIGGLFAGLILLPTIHFGKWDKRIKIAFMILAIPALVLVFVYAFQNFYDLSKIPAAGCSWCKYMSCLPISNWCDQFAT